MLLLWWIIIKPGAPQGTLHTITDYFGRQSVWHRYRRGYRGGFSLSIMWKRSSEANLLKASLSRAETPRRDVCAAVCWSSEGSRFTQVDESAARLRSRWTRPTCVFHQAVPVPPLNGVLYFLRQTPSVESSGPSVQWTSVFPQMILLLSPSRSHPSWVRVELLPLRLAVIFTNGLLCPDNLQSCCVVVVFGYAVQTWAEICQIYIKVLEFLCKESTAVTVTGPGVTLTGIWSIFPPCNC